MSGCRVTLWRLRNGWTIPYRCDQPLADVGRRLCLEHVKERIRLL